MKWMGFIMMTVLLQVSLSGKSQTVSVSGKDLPLKEIFAILKNQTGLLFFYDANVLQDAKPVTIDLKNVSLEMALNELFKDQTLTWVLEDKTVTIIRKQAAFTPSPILPAAQTHSSIRVNGNITDVDGNPISDVSIMIKGTKNGTVSGKVGEFSIEASRKNMLIFSSVNYRTKEVRAEHGELNITLQLDVKPMESLLVGGNLNVVKRKADATAVTVLDVKVLERIPSNTLDQIFRGWVPGTNNFDVGAEPEGFPSLSVRGASGPNSLSTIAVYIDGIEYAGGSGYLSQLDKNDIDRVEIVRGPGAATMYGTGSNGGIVQIFTKKGKSNQTGVNLTTSAGFYKSKWVKNNPFQQMHNLETITGFKNISIKLGGSYRTVDAYLPDGGEKNKGFYVNAGFTPGKWKIYLSSRYNGRNFNITRKPYYDTVLHPRTDIMIEPNPGLLVRADEWFNARPTVSKYKIGITDTYINGIHISNKTAKNWVNSFDVGHTINNSREEPLLNGTAPLQRQYIADRNSITTVRYTNIISMENNNSGIVASITSGAEYKKYSASRTITRATAAVTGISRNPDNENYGAFIQANPSYKNVYLTLGLRYEKNNLFKAAWNPRIGLTTNFVTNFLTIRPRISWGKGITSPPYEARFGTVPTLSAIVYPNPEIKPQSQQGFDFGLELYDKTGKFRIEIGHYDNILQNVIAQEMIGQDPKDTSLVGFRYVNVSKIANTGWEFSGDYQIGRFYMSGTFSIMNSFIKDTTGAYLLSFLSGKPAGTRLRNLPKHTAGFNLSYNFKKIFGSGDKGTISINVTEVDGVISSDYRNYVLDVVYGRTTYNPGVFGYPIEYSPVFKFGLYADYSIVRDLRFFVQGTNILNNYKYDYSNENPTHGAAWLFGLKYSFLKSKN